MVFTGGQPLAGHQPRSWESFVKIKVKKVERIEATRIHLDPDPPQGAM
jgi:hypothetical protein